MNRHDWLPEGLAYLFGPEPEPPPRSRDHLSAIRDCSLTVSKAHQEATALMASDPIAKNFLSVVPPLDKVLNAAPTAVDDPMRVVLMGRTMAGKSTLFAAISNANNVVIGRGGQRTTRDISSAPVPDVPEVEIIDTPGVGAQDGAADVATAMAQVPDADLIVWVSANDSFQEDTAKALREIALLGKPIVVVLNCRAALADDFDREDFLAYPDEVFSDNDNRGHFATISTHLERAGVRPLAQLKMHAEAARQARAGVEPMSQLWAASRVNDLISCIKNERDLKRDSRRLIRDVDRSRNIATAQLNCLNLVVEGITRAVEFYGVKSKDQQQRVKRAIDTAQDEMRDTVAKAVSQRTTWPLTVTDFGSGLTASWEAEEIRLRTELANEVNNGLHALQETLASITEEVMSEWSVFGGSADGIGGFRGSRDAWLRRVSDLAVSIASAVGAMVGTAANPIVGIAAQLGIGVIVKPVRRRIHSIFRSKAEILEENRVLLRSEVARALDRVQSHFEHELSKGIAHFRTALANADELADSKRRASLEVGKNLISLADDIQASLVALDRVTARELLHLEGRHRLAAGVSRATRLPGVSVAIETSPEAFDEAWLFPPSSAERLVFGREGSSMQTNRALTYVLGMTDELPSWLWTSGQKTEIRTRARISRSILDAWSALLSDHLQTPIHIECEAPGGDS